MSIIVITMFYPILLFAQTGNSDKIDGLNKETNKMVASTWTETTNYNWNLGISVDGENIPYELGFYLGQTSYNYYSDFTMVSFDVRYDNGTWINLSQNAPLTGWFTPPWNSVGIHSMDIRYTETNGNTHIISHKIYVVPGRNKLYYKPYADHVSGWTGTTTAVDRPVVIIEGFDPVNVSFPDYYYGKGMAFFDKIRQLDGDVFIFNFINGGIDLASNAQAVKEFLQYLNTIKTGNQKIILAGLSMGGVIARYLLAQAEANGENLGVSHFLSIDSPQQEALIPRDFQDYVRANDDGVPHPTLSSMAAKQMLKGNPYDPDRDNSNSIKNAFYNQLNSLNGDGYPHNTTNIGVSFSPNQRNPNLGEWLTVEISIAPDKHFYLWEDNDCKVAGSYLPLSATMAGDLGFLERWVLSRHLDPTFIPYTSALDIVNGVSKFSKL